MTDDIAALDRLPAAEPDTRPYPDSDKTCHLALATGPPCWIISFNPGPERC